MRVEAGNVHGIERSGRRGWGVVGLRVEGCGGGLRGVASAAGGAVTSRQTCGPARSSFSPVGATPPL